MTKDWPFAGDAPIARARKVALAYRHIAQELVDKYGADTEGDPVADLDERFHRWGELWIDTDRTVTYAADDWVTSQIAATILAVSQSYMSALRVHGRIKGRYIKGKHGYVYRVGDIWTLSSEMRRRPRRSADKVEDDGRSAPE